MPILNRVLGASLTAGKKWRRMYLRNMAKTLFGQDNALILRQEFLFFDKQPIIWIQIWKASDTPRMC